MNSLPLVSIICLCHNQKKYVGSAINSALSQSYENIELIIVDDCSTDGSQDQIRNAIGDKKILFLPLAKNVGNCTAFNMGLARCHGDFIIDLAADDVLMPARVEQGINDFLNASKKVGVHFTDAFLADAEGQIMGTHYSRSVDGQLIDLVPEGDIYTDLIHKYFICPPTMMIRKSVFDELGGYDEKLAYEDFDFWIRSSRRFDYIFNKAPLVKKRMVMGSHANSQNRLLNNHQRTTYLVCKKIFDLNKKPVECKFLIKRCYYEIRQCLLTINLQLIPKYFKLITASKAAYRRLSSASNIEI
ncbi:MAG: glycosyltransferase involved in cell wall biosynthesis [Cyclobacteriaceae bacterium]|jgi:glycosyltransferase involved in cell wall biosynthesis